MCHPTVFFRWQQPFVERLKGTSSTEIVGFEITYLLNDIKETLGCLAFEA
jgi:hypothetical protein